MQTHQVMLLFVFAGCLFFSTVVRAQDDSLLMNTDTTWFNYEWMHCAKEDAAFYRPQSKGKGVLFMKDYYLSGVVQNEYISAKPGGDQSEIKGVWYYPNGDTSAITFLKNMQPVGIARVYYENNKIARVE